MSQPDPDASSVAAPGSAARIERVTLPAILAVGLAAFGYFALLLPLWSLPFSLYLVGLAGWGVGAVVLGRRFRDSSTFRLGVGIGFLAWGALETRATPIGLYVVLTCLWAVVSLISIRRSARG